MTQTQRIFLEDAKLYLNNAKPATSTETQRNYALFSIASSLLAIADKLCEDKKQPLPDVK